MRRPAGRAGPRTAAAGVQQPDRARQDQRGGRVVDAPEREAGSASHAAARDRAGSRPATAGASGLSSPRVPGRAPPRRPRWLAAPGVPQEAGDESQGELRHAHRESERAEGRHSRCAGDCAGSERDRGRRTARRPGGRGGSRSASAGTVTASAGGTVAAQRTPRIAPEVAHMSATARRGPATAPTVSGAWRSPNVAPCLAGGAISAARASRGAPRRPLPSRPTRPRRRPRRWSWPGGTQAWSPPRGPGRRGPGASAGPGGR